MITNHQAWIKLKDVTDQSPLSSHIIVMSKNEPIKRIETLKPLSRDHHHGLLLCWKIRQGIKLNIPLERIKKYLDWFWDSHLQLHFNIEEKCIFPILGNQNDRVRQALAEHRRLKRLFEKEDNTYKSVSLIEEELEKHIRFEERVLFNEIQSVATNEQLKQIELHHSDAKFLDNLSDTFWK